MIHKIDTLGRPMDEQTVERLVKISTMYYEMGLSQQYIADQLNISRSLVSKLLDTAREMGIVEIKVIDPLKGYEDLAARLKKRFHLKKAVVHQSSRKTPSLTKIYVGMAAANFVYDILTNGMQVGISWGSSLYHMVTALEKFAPKYKESPLNELVVVPLLGGMGHVENRFQVNELAMKFAFITGGNYLPLHAPTYVQSVEIKNMLTQDYSIRDILHRWETLDIALVGIGAPIGQSPVLQTDYLSQEEIGNLCRQKAVGDVCTRFFDAMGKPCLSGAEDRTIGIDLETLRGIPLVVGVAGGKEKVDSIRAAIAGGYVNALVTDDFTADKLLFPAQGEEDG